jgi:hypothetical protein
MVGLVIARARHTAKIGAKKWYITAYLVLKDALPSVRGQSVCPSNVIYFYIGT